MHTTFVVETYVAFGEAAFTFCKEYKRGKGRNIAYGILLVENIKLIFQNWIVAIEVRR